MKTSTAPPTVTFIPASSHEKTPWKNGGGSTVQLFISPKGASLDNFEWRLSLAAVEQDGPFSTFENVDRTLSVLSGAGITLDIEGNESAVDLSMDSRPYSFPADRPTRGCLLDGPITDLNMMSVRGRVSHSVQKMACFTEQDITPDGDVTIIFAQTNGVTVTADKAYPMSKNDCLVIFGKAGKFQISAAAAALILISVSRLP